MDVCVTYSHYEFESTDVSSASVVVLDCLRASTSIVAALHAGARGVYPFRGVDEARSFAASRQGTILAGERGGVRIEGFDLGNSPREFTSRAVGGREIAMTTSNGTRLLVSAARSRRVFVAGFVNASATVGALIALDGPVVIAAAGTDGHFSVEDSLCAGLLAALVRERTEVAEDDSAVFARLAYMSGEERVAEALRNGRGARNVKSIGLAADIPVCLAADTMPLVAMALENPLRVVRMESA